MNADQMQGVAVGRVPEGWRPLPEVPLLILVGVTGVGKSTTLAELASLGVRLPVLPDRRVITDEVMIHPLAGHPVQDREERFRLTALYRDTHPGGMAEALQALSIDPAQIPPPALFDGLRGLNEVRHAAAHLPNARFVALGAPDIVRVRRLLGRGDAFDRVQGGATVEGEELETELRALDAEAVFGEDGVRELAAMPAEGLGATDVLAKVRIVLSERRNYDPGVAEDYLRTLPAERALVVDTVRHDPAGVARLIREWL